MRQNKSEELRRYIEELKTIKKEVVSVKQENKFLQSISYMYTLNNGVTIPREKLIKGSNDGSAVIILPLIKNSDEILVTVEPRVFTKHGVSVGFPAGYIEKGEKPDEAALRELREETGYTPSGLKLLDSFYQDEGVSSAYNHILVAYDCEKTCDQELDPYEIVRYMTLTMEELNELETLGFINSSNTKLTLNKAREIRS